MIDGSEKRNRQLAFELQYSHVCEKCSKGGTFLRATKASPKKIYENSPFKSRRLFSQLNASIYLTSLLGLMNGTTEKFQNVFNEAKN